MALGQVLYILSGCLPHNCLEDHTKRGIQPSSPLKISQSHQEHSQKPILARCKKALLKTYPSKKKHLTHQFRMVACSPSLNLYYN